MARKKCRASFVIISVLIAALGQVVVAARTDKSNAVPPPPPTPVITALKLMPDALTLDDGRDARRVLVLGRTPQGDWLDLTRVASFKPAAPVVGLDADGFIEPRRAGSTTVTVSVAGQTAKLPVEVKAADKPPVRYVRDIQPLISKLGCNAGTCHGAAKGREGFFLSLRGYDPDFDYPYLVHDLSGRRVNRVQPDKSLILLKPSAQVPHEGGQVFEVDSRPYRLLLDWIKQGAKYESSTDRVGLKIEVLPKEVDIDLPGRTHEVVVMATRADGTVRDVTREAVLSISDGEVAVMKGNVVTGIRRGEAAVLVRYEGQYLAAPVTVMGDRTGFAWQPMPQNNFIDTHVNAKLKKVKALPSDLTRDGEFVRRVYLDLTGLPPTPQQARAFIEDKTPTKQKRDKLVDQLVGSEAFIENWTNKWADLLQCNSGKLGDKGVWMFRGWIRRALAQNMPYDRFVKELLTAQGGNFTNPAVNYLITTGRDKNTLDTGKITEDVTQTFLGVRFSCNKCHNHPFERWVQDQYYQVGAYFARLKFKPGRLPGETVVYSGFNGEVQNPRTNAAAKPIVPFGKADAPTDRARRDAFARWLVSPDNALFAKSYVNRVWSYFFGRGIIEPVDDIRAGNPPSNPQLLDALTKDFIEHDHDVRLLMRTICKSRTYQISIRTNKWNADDRYNFSHASPRRLTAEQLIDALAVATDVPQRFAGVPGGTRAAQVADGVIKGNDFTSLFGRPKRESACECERTDTMTLSHAMKMIMGPTINEAVNNPSNRFAALVKQYPNDDAKVIEQVYYAVLSRPPTADEIKAIDLRAGGSRLEVAQDLAWALLNSPAFLFNH